MRPFPLIPRTVSLLITPALLSHSLALLAQPASDNQPGNPGVAEGQAIENIYVYGEPGKTDTTTKLNLTLLETPQTVSAISRAQLEDFALSDVNAVLDYAPGVTVEEVETDRTYYTARGFDIVNFQYDGVGTPFTFGVNWGRQDTAIFEQVEVVKGAAGLITGLANPSATINYVRKRPTDNLQMSSRVTTNDWGGYRFQGDVSGALSSRVRARAVVARGDSDSYLDRRNEENDLVYGVIEADLTPTTLVTVGHSYNRNDSSGTMWGALPLVYADGTPTDYDVSTSTGPEWAFADVTRNQTFLELEQYLGADWSFNAVYTQNQLDQESELFYVYGAPDPVTELGLNGWASRYEQEEHQAFIDVYISGAFDLAGQRHELVVGYNQADITSDAASFQDPVNGFPVLGSDWAAATTPRPNFVAHDPFEDAADLEQDQTSLYFSSRLNFTDDLSVLLGARRAEVEQDGFNYGASSETAAEETVPYAGVTYSVTDTTTLYASFSEVFTQQAWVNPDFQPLGATHGENSEIGLKQTFNNGRATLTLARFEAKNHNLGVFARRIDGIAVYTAQDTDSDGYELEFSGEVIEGLNLGAGFTQVDIHNEGGSEARPFVPERLVKLSASYYVPPLPALKLGGVFKWQSEIETAGATFEQKAYGLLDLLVSYDINDALTAALNIGNVTDEKYIQSLYWDQGYYGAPRHFEASFSWQF